MLRLLTSLFVILLLCHQSAQASTSPTGSVELDEFSFQKIVNKFDAALVKFDVAFPYGDKHDAFVALAKDSKDSEELLVAEVGVKDYGEKDNEAIAKKYGATKDNFPAVRLFIKGKDEPIVFDDAKGFTTDALRRFVRENAGIYLNLPGCVKRLDELALKFMSTKNEDDRKNALKETEAAINELANKEKNSGKIYKLVMEKVLEKGDKFVKTENERVKKLLGGKVSDEKKKELNIRVNILQTFMLSEKQRKSRDDL